MGLVPEKQNPTNNQSELTPTTRQQVGEVLLRQHLTKASAAAAVEQSLFFLK
jgi:hypothetical protein